MKMKSRINLLLAITLMCLFSVSYGIPVLTVGTENSDWVLAYSKPDDLLQTNLASMTSVGNFGLWGFGATAASINNGTMGWYTGWASDFASWEANASLTYNLDITVNTQGYDITTITTYAGSAGNGHDDQNYTIYYRVVGSQEWTLFDSLNWTPHYPDLPNDGLYTADMNKAEWTLALQHVDGLKFVAPASVENGFVTLCEIDVIGSASVPEPATMTLLGLGMLVALKKK